MYLGLAIAPATWYNENVVIWPVRRIVTIGHDSGVVQTIVEAVTGRHALFFKITTDYTGWMGEMFKGRTLFELRNFVFGK